MKKFFLFLVIAAIVTVFYTEQTGKTNFRQMFSEKVLGLTEEEETTEEEYQYTLEKHDTSDWDPGKEAIKDADSYHKEAKTFANQAKNTVDVINDAAK
ncbi:MAG: hypothetical protein IKS17_09095 [Firmicutes bacterium]|nr:hypothetical protein [Bacillota bacterium]